MVTLKKYAIAVVVWVSICLGGCTHLYISTNTLDTFSKGMTLAHVKTLTPSSPIHEFEITTANPSGRVTVLVYELSIGDYKSDYFLAFGNDKLLYWGYPHEFARSSDIYLNDVGRIAVEEYLKIK